MGSQPYREETPTPAPALPGLTRARTKPVVRFCRWRAHVVQRHVGKPMLLKH